MTDDNKRYKKLESVLQQISKQIIALPEEEVKTNNWILREVSDYTRLFKRSTKSDTVAKIKVKCDQYIASSYFPLIFAIHGWSRQKTDFKKNRVTDKDNFMLQEKIQVGKNFAEFVD